MPISPQDRHAMRSYQTVQIHNSQKLTHVQYVEITNVYYNFTKIRAHICVFRYFFVILHRVRQLVAMVHTTPLNGRAPNASALRSDYRIR